LETAHDDRSALWLLYLLYDRAEGMALSNTNFRRRVWLAAVGIKGVHIHDLCHAGGSVPWPMLLPRLLGLNLPSPRRAGC
jgi:hypothetical protein